MERVKSLDAAWLYLESPETPMHVGCLQIFALPRGAGRTYVKKLVQTARTITQLEPPFSLKRHRSALGSVLPSWEEETQPDMTHHVPHHALPEPGDARELENLVARLQSDELDTARPLWECHIIEGLADHRFAIFTKIHHSLLDGVGGMRLLETMLATSPKDRGLPALWSRHPDHHRSAPHDDGDHTPGAVIEHVLHFAATQLHAMQGLYRTAKAFGKAALDPKSSPLASPYTAPKSMLNGPVSQQHRLVTLDLSLTRVRRLGKRAGVTVNDVFLAMCAGALRRYMQEHNALPEQPLVAGLPVSLRPAGDTTVGTLVTFILSSLGTDLDDPVERLMAIHRSTLAAKHQLQELDRAALTEYTLLLMAPFIVKLLSGLGATGHPIFNLVISNVPGPSRPLYYNGARLTAMYPTSIVTHGQALNITVLSYARRLNVGFTACGHSVPHPERLAQYAVEALEELESSLQPRRRRRSAA